MSQVFIAIGILSVALAVSRSTFTRATRTARSQQPDNYSKLIMPGHGAEVESVVFSPDGRVVATGSRDQTVKLWDVQTGELLRTLTGHSGDLDSIAFSPDGSILAITGKSLVNLYRPDNGELIRSLAGCGIAGHAAFSSDGKLLITKSTSENNLKLWEIQTGKLSKVLIGVGGYVKRIAFSLDGKTIAGISNERVLRLWDAREGKDLLTLSDFKYSLEDVAFTPDGSKVAVADDITVIFLDPQTGKREREVHSDKPVRNFEPPVRSITFSPDGQQLAVASNDDLLTVLDVGSGRPKYQLHQDARPEVAAFSPDGNTLITGCEPKAIYVWDLKTTELKIKIGNEAQSYAVAFSPDGKTIVSDGGFFYSTLSFWGTQNGKLLRTLGGHDGAMSKFLFSPDGKSLYGAESSSSKVYEWDLDSGEIVHTLELAGPTEASALVLSPDAKTMAVAGDYGDGTIKILNPRTLEINKTIIASRSVLEPSPSSGRNERTRLGVVCAQFSRDGRLFAAVVDQGGTLKFWNARTWLLLRSVRLKVDDVLQCSFSPELDLLVTNYRFSNPRVAHTDIWETRRGTLTHSLPSQVVFGQYAFSPDGKIIATAGKDMTVNLWDVQTGKLKSTFTGHSNEVSSAEFSRDGQTLITGSLDGTVRLWNVSTGETRQVWLLGDSRLPR